MDISNMIEAGRHIVERRAMLKRAGVATTAAALGLAGLSSPATAASVVIPPASPPTAMDVNILNFALNLEYLDSTYYHLAVLGTDLKPQDVTSTDGSTTLGTLNATGVTPVSFQTDIIRQFADTFTADEQAHVEFIRANLAALGQPAVARPAMDLSVGPNSSFSQLAVKAGIISQGQTFNPYQDENAFLLGAFIFEDVAVTAYAGSAALLSMGSELVQFAGSIMAVEAYHAATIRTLLAIRGGGNATDAIASVRSMASSGALPGTAQGDDYGTLDTAAGVVVLAPTDANALAFRRSTQQILNIVYGSSGPTRMPGLFFPNGLNALPGAAALGFA